MSVPSTDHDPKVGPWGGLRCCGGFGEHFEWCCQPAPADFCDDDPYDLARAAEEVAGYDR